MAGWLEEESCAEDFYALVAAFAATVGSESLAVDSWSSSSSLCTPQSHFHNPVGWKVEVLELFGISLKYSDLSFLEQIVHQISLCY